MHESERTVPLLPRRRVHGSPVGDMRSGRRGEGAELVGLREYRRGDDLRRVDQRATARASRARGTDVLLVREFYAEEAARVVLVLDRRPSMRLFPARFPWLRKPAAVREIVRLVVDSAFEQQAPVGCLTVGAAGGIVWSPPARRPHTAEWVDEAADAAPVDSLARVFAALGRLPRLGKGTFVFVVSDFLEPPDEEAWWRLLARGWDPVPVVVQDPVWEQSFPAVAGVPLPVADAGGAPAMLVRLTRREAVALSAMHQARFKTMLQRLRALTLEPICVGADDRASVHAEFQRWAAARAGRLR